VKFKQTFHQTIIDYLNTLRIEHTKSLLREGTYTLTQIADSMNMSSVHYLTTLFKKITNMTPTEYVHTLKETLQG
jgi:YesN/AraC family two-component response regulator